MIQRPPTIWRSGCIIAPSAAAIIANAQGVADEATSIGIDSDALLAGIESQDTKDRTRTENDAAIARGIFGSPYIIVDGEPFWGADRLDQVAKWLETGGW